MVELLLLSTGTRSCSEFETAVTEAGDLEVLNDIKQLEGLVTWRTREQWVPVVPGDLPDRCGRQLAALRDAVIDAVRGTTTGKSRNGTSDFGPGRYLTTPGGRTLWAGLLYNQWGSLGLSPAWIWVGAKTQPAKQDLLEALAELAGPGGPGLFELANACVVPLHIPIGEEIGAVSFSFAKQIEVVAALLDTAAVETVEAPISSDG